MKCPNPDCGGKVVQKSDNGDARMRVDGPIEIVGGECRARCYWCKSSVTLPLQLIPGSDTPIPDKITKTAPVIERITFPARRRPG